MTAQIVASYFDNGKQNGVSGNNRAGRRTLTSKLWDQIEINEWTFSLFLLVLSLTIVTGKLFVNYGDVIQWPGNIRTVGPSIPEFSSVYDIFAIPVRKLSNIDSERLKIASKRLTNTSRQYGDTMTDAVADITHKFGWFARATFCGLAMMGFTWFIIYKDSSVPGVNPPIPFSPSKKQYPEKSRLQINYLVGVLNGVLIFVYMCI